MLLRTGCCSPARHCFRTDYEGCQAEICHFLQVLQDRKSNCCEVAGVCGLYTPLCAAGAEAVQTPASSSGPWRGVSRQEPASRVQIVLGRWRRKRRVQMYFSCCHRPLRV